MTRYESPEVLKLLQVFWPIEWSQRMSRDMEERTADELANMFKDYSLEEVQTVIRTLARTIERPPTYKRIMEDLDKARGKKSTDPGFRWAQYVYQVFQDSQGRGRIKDCNVKIYPDGKVSIPKGVPWNDRLLYKQEIIDENGNGIYDEELHRQKWGPVWRERRKKILDGMDPKEAIKAITPETMGTADRPQEEPEPEESEIPEGFQQVIDDIFNEW